MGIASANALHLQRLCYCFNWPAIDPHIRQFPKDEACASSTYLYCNSLAARCQVAFLMVTGLWQSFFAPCGRGRKRDWGTPPGPRKGAAAPLNPAFSRSCNSRVLTYWPAVIAPVVLSM